MTAAAGDDAATPKDEQDEDMLCSTEMTPETLEQHGVKLSERKTFATTKIIFATTKAT